MPKTRSRKKGASSSKQPQARAESMARNAPAPQPATKTRTGRAFVAPPVRGPQSLVWPFMVALGCWGLAISFFFFYADPNHVLYGGLAAAMALLWSYSVGIRVRKLLQRRSNA